MIQTQRNGKHVALRRAGDKEPAFEADTYAEVLRWSREQDEKTPEGLAERTPGGLSEDPDDDEPVIGPTGRSLGHRSLPPTAKPVKVGDFVQWTTGGIDMLEEPKKITRVEDGFGFTEDSGTGMPLDELKKAKRPRKGDA